MQAIDVIHGAKQAGCRGQAEFKRTIRCPRGEGELTMPVVQGMDKDRGLVKLGCKAKPRFFALAILAKFPYGRGVILECRRVGARRRRDFDLLEIRRAIKRLDR
ncbi:MAG: hypothetical protein ACRYGK_00205 [Janthinobacterium lividum]